MHPHIIAAAQAAAQASPGDRNALAIGAAALVFGFGVWCSRSSKKKPNTAK